MPHQIASKIELSEKQKCILEEFKKGTHIQMHLKMRSEIILLANEGKTNNEIERLMNRNPATVKLWRDKYSKNHTELEKIEKENPNKLRSAIVEILSDDQRIGAPPKFTDEQVAAIIMLSCEEPEKLGLPFSHWTPGLLKTESIKRGIVTSISTRQVGRFLKMRMI